MVIMVSVCSDGDSGGGSGKGVFPSLMSTFSSYLHHQAEFVRLS